MASKKTALVEGGQGQVTEGEGHSGIRLFFSFSFFGSFLSVVFKSISPINSYAASDGQW